MFFRQIEPHSRLILVCHPINWCSIRLVTSPLSWSTMCFGHYASSYDLKGCLQSRLEQAHELEEFWLTAYESPILYNERMKKLHNVKILKKEFCEGDKVLVFKLMLTIFAGKLILKWSGHFGLKNVYLSGDIKLADHEKRRFMVNGQWCKHYYVGGPEVAKVELICFKDSCWCIITLCKNDSQGTC